MKAIRQLPLLTQVKVLQSTTRIRDNPVRVQLLCDGGNFIPSPINPTLKEEKLLGFLQKTISHNVVLDITEQNRIKISVRLPLHWFSLSVSLSVTAKGLRSSDSKAVTERRSSCSCWHNSVQVCYRVSILHWAYREAFVFSMGRSWPFSATLHNTVLYFFMSFRFIAK